MARTPVMLTALAVVHWHERRLPEQRAELYECVLKWLARSREQKPGRETPDRALELLRELALAMQIHPRGFQKQVTQRDAAELIAGEFATTGTVDKGSLAKAERFIEAEELDSGIIVGRARHVEFWHRTFQEYLTASAVGARSEAEQEELLFEPKPRLYQPEWRAVMPLLAGVLRQQGARKVDLLFETMVRRLSKPATLAEEARCAGLMGVMLRDLAPYGYAPPGGDYPALLQRVKAIFDPVESASVPIATRIEAADALGQVGDSRFNNMHSDGYWVTIPACTFWMGAQSDAQERNYDLEARDDESPVHAVTLAEYAIAKDPVTVAEYEQFVKDDGYQDSRWWNEGGFGEFAAPEDWDDQQQYPARPVVGVSWYEAAAYSHWAGFRLPTEAEWERAARGLEARRFPWSRPGEADEPTAERVNFAPEWKVNVGHSTPPGIYPTGATPEGIQDMGGNVAQWCSDWYGAYSADKVADPKGAPEGSYRVFRGGSWLAGASGCRSAFRLRVGPVVRDYFLGFRLASQSVRQVKSGSGAGSAGSTGARSLPATRDAEADGEAAEEAIL